MLELFGILLVPYWSASWSPCLPMDGLHKENARVGTHAMEEVPGWYYSKNDRWYVKYENSETGCATGLTTYIPGKKK